MPVPRPLSAQAGAVAHLLDRRGVDAAGAAGTVPPPG